MKWSYILFLLLSISLFSCNKDKKIKIDNNEQQTKTEINENENDFRRENLRRIYTSQLHVREIGSNKGSDIYKYQKSAGIKSGMPWCGSFVFWAYLEADITPDVKSPAIANSWFLNKNKIIVIRGENKKRRPSPGDVIGISYTKGKIGHVGFYDSESDDFYTTIEGNTGGKRGTNDTEGVHKLKRIKRQVLYISNYIDEL